MYKIKKNYFRASTSSKPSNEKYANGLVKGSKITDIVKLGEINFEQQQFGSANVSSFHSDQFDGIIGFGFHAYTSDNVNPIVDQLKTYLDKPQFTVVLKNNISSNGVVTFGKYDTVNCASLITYAPIVLKTFQWKVKLSGYAIGNYKVNREQRIELRLNDKVHMIPKAALVALVKQTKAVYDKNLGYVVNCTTIDVFPAIELNLNGVKHTLEGLDYTEVVRNFEYILNIQKIV